MEYYSTEGLVEGYIHRVPTKAMFTMDFIIDNQITLHFNVTHQATVSEDCGIRDVNLNKWMWEKGNEFILSEAIHGKSSITVKANDVVNGTIVTPFKNLEIEVI